MSPDAKPPTAGRPAFPVIGVVVWVLVGGLAGARAAWASGGRSFGVAAWDTLVWATGAAGVGAVIGLLVGVAIGGPGDTWGQRLLAGLTSAVVVAVGFFVVSLMGFGGLNLLASVAGETDWRVGAGVGAAVGACLPVLRWLANWARG